MRAEENIREKDGNALFSVRFARRTEGAASELCVFFAGMGAQSETA